MLQQKNDSQQGFSKALYAEMLNIKGFHNNYVKNLISTNLQNMMTKITSLFINNLNYFLHYEIENVLTN
jgi:hypothetical protein